MTRVNETWIDWTRRRQPLLNADWWIWNFELREKLQGGKGKGDTHTAQQCIKQVQSSQLHESPILEHRHTHVRAHNNVILKIPRDQDSDSRKFHPFHLSLWSDYRLRLAKRRNFWKKLTWMSSLTCPAILFKWTKVTQLWDYEVLKLKLLSSFIDQPL